MRQLSATRVVAFIDVVDSVGLYRRLGDAAAQLLIDKTLDGARACALEDGGQCVKRNGDELLLLFDSADAACRALVAAQRAASLDLRMGAHTGPLIKKRNDVFGDTVNIAARLTAIARAREIVISEAVRGDLSHALQNNCRPFEKVRLRGTARTIAIFHLCWEESAATRLNSAVAVTSSKRQRLLLQTPAGPVALAREQELTIGRDPQCDVVIDDERVSRFHATIEWRRGMVMLRDHSTNGSFVRLADETQGHFLRREALPIRGAGLLSFGAGGTDCAVEYRFE
jgi:class 3 adenylate cyclase